MQFEVVENPKRHSESFSFCYVHCVKSIQIRSFFLVCIFLYSDWIWRDTLILLDRICKKMTRKPLREKCPNTELFLVRIYCIRTEYGEILRYSDTLFVFSPNTGKYGPEITPYLDTFRAVVFLSVFYKLCLTKLVLANHIFLSQK